MKTSVLNPTMQNFGLYLHIPFCKQACHYCDFHFSTNLRPKGEVLKSIAQELKLQKEYVGDAHISSIYFGGGTPSLLEASEIESLLELITQLYTCQPRIEITLEANPDDITLEKLQNFKSSGINRLSIGIQSFQDQILSYLNRVHNSKDAISSVEIARKAGFNNLSIDLMYGIPNGNCLWGQDLATASALQPEHISAYCLTVEKDTVFGRWQQHGKFTSETEETIVKQFETLVGVLESHQYEHYEVSNFSKPGQYAAHNMNYWKQGGYLGVGPGAHSYNGNTRQYNISNNHKYVQSIQQGVVPCTVELLTRENHINEYIMTSLRTQWGCDLALIKVKYEYDLEKKSTTYLEKLFTEGMATLRDGILFLTPKGKLLADQIAKELFCVDS